jgi:hypothetical protein
MPYASILILGLRLGQRGGNVLGSDLGVGLNPLLLGHRLVADNVVTDRLIEVLNVTPFARASVLEPKADRPEIAGDGEFIAGSG